MDIFECEEFVKLAYEVDSTLASEAFTRIRQESNISGKDIDILWRACCGGDVEKTLDIMRFAEIKNIIDHILFAVPFYPSEF